MIIEPPTSPGDMSGSKLLQQTTAPPVVDCPPAYSEIHGPSSAQGSSGLRREQSYRIAPVPGRRDSRRRRHGRHGSREQGRDGYGYGYDAVQEHPHEHQYERQYQQAEGGQHHGHGPAHAHDNSGHGRRQERRYGPGHGHGHGQGQGQGYGGGSPQVQQQQQHQPSVYAHRAGPPVPTKEELPDLPVEDSVVSPSTSEYSTGPPTMGVIPLPTSDQIHIADHRHDIKGTFYVDPTIESLDPARRQKKKSKETPPHASFRTRHQEIDIELATTGNGAVAPKAKVAVSSVSKRIRVKLLPMHPTRPRIGLDVQSRHGDIIVFIPDNYVGVIQLSTRKGKLDVLPALASHMKVVKSSEHDMLFMVGDAHEGVDTSREASFCDLDSRTGNVIIGLANRDTYAEKPGFWKRMGSLLKGESTTSETK